MKASFVIRFRHQIARLPVLILCLVPMVLALIYFSHRHRDGLISPAAPATPAATEVVTPR